MGFSFTVYSFTKKLVTCQWYRDYQMLKQHKKLIKERSKKQETKAMYEELLEIPQKNKIQKITQSHRDTSLIKSHVLKVGDSQILIPIEEATIDDEESIVRNCKERSSEKTRAPQKFSEDTCNQIELDGKEESLWKSIIDHCEANIQDKTKSHIVQVFFDEKFEKIENFKVKNDSDEKDSNDTDDDSYNMIKAVVNHTSGVDGFQDDFIEHTPEMQNHYGINDIKTQGKQQKFRDRVKFSYKKNKDFTKQFTNKKTQVNDSLSFSQESEGVQIQNSYENVSVKSSKTELADSKILLRGNASFCTSIDQKENIEVTALEIRQSLSNSKKCCSLEFQHSHTSNSIKNDVKNRQKIDKDLQKNSIFFEKLNKNVTNHTQEDKQQINYTNFTKKSEKSESGQTFTSAEGCSLGKNDPVIKYSRGSQIRNKNLYPSAGEQLEKHIQENYNTNDQPRQYTSEQLIQIAKIKSDKNYKTTKTPKENITSIQQSQFDSISPNFSKKTAEIHFQNEDYDKIDPIHINKNNGQDYNNCFILAMTEITQDIYQIQYNHHDSLQSINSNMGHPGKIWDIALILDKNSKLKFGGFIDKDNSDNIFILDNIHCIGQYDRENKFKGLCAVFDQDKNFKYKGRMDNGKLSGDFVMTFDKQKQQRLGSFKNGKMINGAKYCYGKNDQNQLIGIRFYYEEIMDSGVTRIVKSKLFESSDEKHNFEYCYKQAVAKYMIDNKKYKMKIPVLDPEMNVQGIGHWRVDKLSVFDREVPDLELEDSGFKVYFESCLESVAMSSKKGQ